MTSGDRPVVLFDGRCGFCAWSVQFAQQRVATDAEFLPYQSVDVSAYGLTEEQCAQAVYYVDRDGACAGELAVAAILRSGRGGWRPLGHVIASPAVRPLAAGIYRVVARHRGKLWGVGPPIS